MGPDVLNTCKEKPETQYKGGVEVWSPTSESLLAQWLHEAE